MEENLKEKPVSWLKETLENQVELISERSKNSETGAELLDLTNAMVAILEYVARR